MFARQTATAAPAQDNPLSWDVPQLQKFGDNSFQKERLAALTDPIGSGGEGQNVEGPGDVTKQAVAGVSVSVSVDSENDGSNMRDALLRGSPFYFSEALIAHHANDKDFQFFISVPNQTTRATTKAIEEHWGKQQRVKIDVPGAVVASLRSYRMRFLTHTLGLKDGLPASIGTELETLLVKADAGDATAIARIIELSAQEPLVASAVERLTADGQRPSSGIQLAVASLLAKKRIEQDAFNGPLTDEQRAERTLAISRIDALLAEASALDLAGNALQAAQRNTQAAQVYRSLGMEQEAADRDYITRMYLRTDEERADVWNRRVSRSSPNSDSMGALPTETRALLDYYRRVPALDPKNQAETGISSGRKLSAVDPDTSTKLTDQKEISTKNGTAYTPTRAIEANTKGIEGAKKGKSAKGGASLLNEINLWATTHREMLELAANLAERDHLQKASLDAHTYVKPPRPEEVDEVQKDFDAKFGNLTEAQAPGISRQRRSLALAYEAARVWWR